MALLEYESPDAAPKTITLKQSDNDVRLIFPPPPKWLGLLNVAISGLVAGAIMAGVAWLTLGFYRITRGIPVPTSSWVVPMLINTGVVLLYLVEAIYIAAHFRRWGHTPKVLQLTPDELIWSAPGFWRLHQRGYPAVDIESIEVLPVRDLFGRKTNFKLRCRRKRGRAIVRHFSTRDPELPKQIERAFRGTLRHSP